jgi:hypothetical protein
MKKIIILVFLLSNLKSFSQLLFKADSGEITFYSYAPIEDIKATSKQINSFINFSTNEFAFMIPIRSFHFEKSLMEEHFNEKYMESDKFPQATFKGTIDQKIDPSKDGKYDVTATGKMNIHGVENDISEPGQIEIKGDKINVTTDFHVAIKDYNITIPQILFNNIADTIDVKLNAAYSIYQKK